MKLTKIELELSLKARWLGFSLANLSAPPLPIIPFTDAALAAAILPLDAMKRSIMPFFDGWMVNRFAGTWICGVDTVRDNFSDNIDADGALDVPMVFCTVFDRMYFGGDRWWLTVVDWPLTGLGDDEMPESSENADTLSLIWSLSGVLDRLECPSMLCGDDGDWFTAPPVTKPPPPPLPFDSIIFFSRSSRSRFSTSFISAWMRFNGSSFYSEMGESKIDTNDVVENYSANFKMCMQCASTCNVNTSTVPMYTVHLWRERGTKLQLFSFD